MLNNNVVYKSQFASMSFITITTFKMAMLPKYMASVAGRDSWLSVIVLMALEIMMYIAVYYVVRRINFQEDKNKLIIAPIMILILLVSLVRVSVLYSEMINYTATTLFDHNRSNFIVLAFAPVLAYLVYKGGNVLGRLSEILLYVLIVVLILQAMLIRMDVDWTNLLPIMVDNGEDMFSGIYMHFMWFGDFMPLLFFSVVDNKTKALNKLSIPLALTIGGGLVVLLFLVFTAAYGDAGVMVNYAFNKLAVFNKVSALIGASNALSVTTWLIMAIMQLSLIIYSATSALSYFIKSKSVAILLVITTVSLVEIFWIQKVDRAYVFAIGWIKWFVASVQYIVPIILVVYAKYRAKNNVSEYNKDLCEQASNINSVQNKSTKTVSEHTGKSEANA